MNRQTEIVNEIKRECGAVEQLSQMGCYFMYSGQHYIYIMTSHDDEMRFCIPHLAKAANYDRRKLTDAINETNRNMKFVKAIVLESGSVSIGYGHKLTDGESIDQVVPQIIQSLNSASTYLINKLQAV